MEIKGKSGRKSNLEEKKKLILWIRISLPILYFKDIFDLILFDFIFFTIKSNMEK